jgi:hypothetical protein
MAIVPPTRWGSDKRFGWYRVYEDFPGHPKWLLVSARSGVHVAFVEAIVQRMFAAASKARAEGHIGGFDIEVCAAGANIPPEQVAAVYRVLNDIGWLHHGVIVDWADRNPRDKTSTDRQRNKRARDDARAAVAAGIATPEQEGLLKVEEREALARLAAMSRVTAAPPAPAPVEIIRPFVPVRPKEDTHHAHELARVENERLARAWLLGDGSRGIDYGPASKMVAENFGCRRMSADATIRTWLDQQMDGDVVALACIISQADELALGGEHFRNVIEQRMAEYARERHAGPTLPLGIASIKGGRGAA